MKTRLIFTFAFLGAIGLIGLAWYLWSACLSPPDLRSCTHIDIEYYPSAWEYFFPDAYGESLVTQEELRYLQTTGVFSVSDPTRIEHLAQYIDQGTFKGIIGWRTRQAPYYFVRVVCFKGRKPWISFVPRADEIVVGEKTVFGYSTDTPLYLVFEPAELMPFRLRRSCARNLERLSVEGPLNRADVGAYPEPSEWSDVVLSARSHTYMPEGMFVCPGAGDGRCHYAMNPNCRPNSPGDTVLLFEAKAGWNQHGGPELFTFGNHDPEGGCVLLNDGTIKFIRTEGELAQLRWE